MNSRERLTRCYFHRETDRPGVYVRTGFPANDPSYRKLQQYIAAHTDRKASWNAMSLLTTDGKQQTIQEPHSPDWVRIRTLLKTPRGELEACHLSSLKGQPGLQTEHFIKTRQDAEKYLSLPLPEVHGNDSEFLACQAAIGEQGITETKLGFNPAGFAAELCGSETFALLSVTDRDIIHALCQRRLAVITSVLEHCLALGIGPFFAMLGEEYVVPPLHGPKDFADFNIAYDQPIIDRIHEAGGAIHIHCHGKLREVLTGFAAMGTDVLHPVEPPPCGNVTPQAARDMLGSRVCIEGNLPIEWMYERSPDEVRTETTELIAAVYAADHGGLIVCPSASPYIRGQGEACLEQFRAMIETVRNWSG